MTNTTVDWEEYNSLNTKLFESIQSTAVFVILYENDN